MPRSHCGSPFNNFYEYIVRVDRQFGASDLLFGHYYQDFFELTAVDSARKS